MRKVFRLNENLEENYNYYKKVHQLIRTYKVLMFSQSWNPYSAWLRDTFREHDLLDFKFLDMDKLADGDKLQRALYEYSGQPTLPNIYIGGFHVGGYFETTVNIKTGFMKTLLDRVGVKHSFLTDEE